MDSEHAERSAANAPTLPGIEAAPPTVAVEEISEEELALLLDIANAAAAAVLVDAQFHAAGPNTACVRDVHDTWSAIKTTVAAWHAFLAAPPTSRISPSAGVGTQPASEVQSV